MCACSRHRLNVHFRQVREYRTFFTKPNGELDQLSHRSWYGAGLDFEFPALVALDDLAPLRCINRCAGMAGIGQDTMHRHQCPAEAYE